MRLRVGLVEKKKNQKTRMGLNENGPSVPKIQIFHPTLDEMKDFSAYIHKIEEMGANKAGLAKVINFNLV